ncbi:hypothetical protein ACFFJI_10160 [Allobacillus sp. GCM10007491]|uniref:Histone deacetylase n=1 Tax=Allobacillus saliphilus TaxID=2912308 RepID=A0A941CUE9_9BACI|nr:hypothetical protein [Allobacillus saliphilus]MBR7552588.1 hypothetical protein [Allobacillus saliphilus]
MENYVWYASYGSNINQDRFYAYIFGDIPPGGTVSEVGCRDQSLPLRAENVMIDFPMFFAKRSSRWDNKGVGFIDTTSDPERPTYGRMYLITKEQYVDVVRQENNDMMLEIDFNQLESMGEYVIDSTKMYGKVLDVGEKEGRPIYTFTHPHAIDPDERITPSITYLKVIGAGIKEAFGISTAALVDYYLLREEVAEVYSREELMEYLAN